MSAGDLARMGLGFPALPLAILALAVFLLILSLFFHPKVQMLVGIFLLFAIANLVSL